MRTGRAALALALALSLSAPAPAAAQEHDHSAGDASRLGKVSFPTSCSAAAKAPFDRAMALLHSFWFSAAIEGFERTLEADPACAIAHWGIALAHWGNPFAGVTSPESLRAGRAAVDKAKAAGAKSQRERDYLAAVELLYKDHEQVDRATRTAAYERAMEELSRKYPNDPEAAAFYGLTLSWIASPTDKSYAKLLKAGAILEKLFERQPDHPGLAHYIIHAYDVPPLAGRALDAARRYAKIAPDAPHALHMPSHTFTRVGSWEESIETNIASARAAKKANSPGEVLHALDYQTYAYLQTAQDLKAKRALDELGAMLAAVKPGAGFGYGLAGAFAGAAIPARFALERGQWSEAAALQPRPGPLPWIDAMTHFARALGAARGGDPASARRDVEQLVALHAALRGKDEYWAGQVEVQRQAAAAWIARADGRPEEALALLRGAADLEEASEKSAISPGPLAPARELLGEMLLEADKPALALPEFEANLKKEPNRFRSLYGAARAASLAGETAKAKAYYSQLLESCRNADAERPELREARKAVGRAAS